MPVAMLVVGLLVGGAAGALALGPQLAKAEAPAAAEHEADEYEDEYQDEEEYLPPKAKAARKGGDGAVIYRVENLVLNPAGSGGTRFLISTVALSVRDSATVTRLEHRDSEVRDALLHLLGAKSVLQLADPAARPALKEEVAAELKARFGRRAIVDVFFPQFVIQ